MTFIFFGHGITGKVLGELSIIAVCNDTNFCQDYEIVCNNGRVFSSTPLSGAVIQHEFDWEDSRVSVNFSEFC